jgi:hypothetical protein
LLEEEEEEELRAEREINLTLVKSSVVKIPACPSRMNKAAAVPAPVNVLPPNAPVVRPNNHPRNSTAKPVDMCVVVDLLEGKINAPA